MYSPKELKIIIDIANKHKIPISLGDDSITIHSKQDLKPLMMFSTSGLDILISYSYNNVGYYREVGKFLRIFMLEKVTV